MRVRGILLSLFVIAGGICSSGCALLLGTAAGAATVSYIEGKLESSLETPLPRAFAATKDAMDELKFMTTSAASDAVSARVEARDAKDRAIIVTLDRSSEILTKVTIRVGVFGDEELSRLILERIRAEAGAAPDPRIY